MSIPWKIPKETEIALEAAAAAIARTEGRWVTVLAEANGRYYIASSVDAMDISSKTVSPTFLVAIFDDQGRNARDLRQRTQLPVLPTIIQGEMPAVEETNGS